ncbi:hypothetical protein C8N24_0522 [Solirubrobacter pauli]|uniref:Uncharacterized protein n=1 Tax=Solirubrobacter pauli TaxID=166793 RepID=A0A660L872_9ACTN|nr:hypothetical protein [Solirubrobacter pauli]RKQ90709.1 hypothetical protein C8N24_0522 [Solirubrobacter pauli]
MTDLPQLQTLLVHAAVKRRRRRRVRRAAAPVLALAVLVAAIPWVLHDVRVPDREEPVTPSVVPSVEEAFGPFQGPDTAPLNDRRAGDRVRRVGRPAHRAPVTYLRLRGDQLCLIVRIRPLCAVASELVSGHRILFGVVNGRGYAVLPNGVRSVRREWTGFEPAPFAVTNNLVVFSAPVGGGRLDWVAPDGTPAHLEVRNPKDPHSFYPRLNEPATEADRYANLPGARLLAGAEGVRAWLVPRRQRICLVVELTGGSGGSVCRRPDEVSTPLVIATPAEPQVVVAAFPSTLVPLEVSPATARSRVSADGILVLDGTDLTALRWRDTQTGSDVQLRTPFAIDGYVLNGEAGHPSRYPAK